MAALPSPNQVAGSHIGIYEAYYNIVDPGGRLGSVGASDAARFLKRSGLPDGVLGRVWDLSDPTGKGALDRTGFFVALKLVSLAQNGKEVSMASIMADSPPPKMGDIPVNNIPNNIIPPSIAGTVNSGSEWSIKPAEKSKYDQLFESLRPVNGLLPGNKVKGVMLNSKLPTDTLGKIWDLADMDKDGMLNRHEFTVAMHLVYKALDKHSIPNVLPPELAAPKKAEVLAHNNNHLVLGLDAAKPPVVNPPAKPPPIVNAANAMPPTPPVASVLPLVTPAMPNWVVTAEERRICVTPSN
ncbi:hypothetical protein J437_LFUL007031 [Ladona fulva]|uniref:Epidermal growth factor receptor substrate 15-like 1 n=1 Tax=Ladona fulva TaxID=123851 RepID=A0A8K0K9E2_LADFU|nr:hypothetical protein J437_LFUL007031 [Ladona fulva]